ncbi:hypothetical protein Tco_0587571 [Tanacetum coccineum]
METRNEKMQTPISIPTRSPRKDLSSDKIISEELTTTVSPTTATTSKDSSTLKHKKRSISYKTKILPWIKVDVLFEYGLLESITETRADKKKYTFKESDFRRLNLNDIEDMYILKAQGKLKHLTGTTKYYLVQSLLVFMRSVIIKKRVKDVQLGVESYQKSLNIIKSQKSILMIKHYPPYTTCPKPFGVVYEGRGGKKRKHAQIESSGTEVRVAVQHRVSIRDVQRSTSMLMKIEAVLKERRQIRRLEVYVGGRPKTQDIRLFVRPQ